MKNAPAYCFALLFMIGCLRSHAQAYTLKQIMEVDSLKKELQDTKSDTVKIKLRCRVGYLLQIYNRGYWDSLIADARRYHMRGIEGKSIQGLGRALLIRGPFDQSLDCFYRSYDIARETMDTAAMFLPLMHLSRYYYVKNDIEKALNHCYTGLKLAELSHDKLNVANLSVEASLCYFSAKETQKSLDMLWKCLKIYKELNHTVGIVKTLMLIGTDYYWLHNDSLSSGYYLECKKYIGEFGPSTISADMHNSIGMAYIVLRQYDSAYKYCRLGYEIAQQLNSKEFKVSAMIPFARTCLLAGKTSEAKKLAEEALQIARTTQFKQHIMNITLTLRDVYVREGEYKKALEVYELHVTMKDSLLSETNKKQTLEKEFNYNLEKKETENMLLTQKNQSQLLGLLGMGALLVLIIIIAYLFYRQNRLRSEQKSTALEQKLLRSQMNPHFIFNSLQAIHNFVLKEDKRQAESYLGSFASVMRDVLENSRMDFIPLKKEINLLESYLQLQKLRFGQRFDYVIKKDEAIDPANTFVPPMLAQPFIENAIEHGFHDISGGGRISISYVLKDSALVMEITDNGIGMKQQGTETGKHQSLAMEITRERVALMNKKAKKKVTFVIEEAFPLDERRGVKVIFTLPLPEGDEGLFRSHFLSIIT